MERLRRDGACSTQAVQRRVLAIAEERKIPPTDYRWMMFKRISTLDVMEFGTKYNISFDWLLCGDLKGLHLMMGKPCAGVSTVERIMEKYSRLSPDLQRVLTEQANRLLAEQAVEGPEAS